MLNTKKKICRIIAYCHNSNFTQSEVLHTFSRRVLCALAVYTRGNKVVRHRFSPEGLGFIRLAVVLHTGQSRGFLHKEYRDQLRPGQ